MMKQSKKGITLVELVICCAIIVLLGGACTAVLVSGQTIFNTSSKTANAQLDADVLQTYLMNLLPPAKNVGQIALADAKVLENGNCIFFDNDNGNLFTLRVDKENTTIRSISGFEYSVVRAGEDTSDTARAQLKYTVTLTDGSTFDGGFVLGNLKYDDTMSSITGSAKDNPLSFNVPDTP